MPMTQTDKSYKARGQVLQGARTDAETPTDKCGQAAGKVDAERRAGGFLFIGKSFITAKKWGNTVSDT